MVSVHKGVLFRIACHLPKEPGSLHQHLQASAVGVRQVAQVQIHDDLEEEDLEDDLHGELDELQAQHADQGHEDGALQPLLLRGLRRVFLEEACKNQDLHRNEKMGIRVGEGDATKKKERNKSVLDMVGNKP